MWSLVNFPYPYTHTYIWAALTELSRLSKNKKNMKLGGGHVRRDLELEQGRGGGGGGF